MNVRQFIKAVFSKKRRKQRANHDDGAGDDLRRMDSRSSYMQQRRKVYVNMELPASEYDEKGRRVHRHYVSNRVRTAKYTPLTFVPKNLFEQFRNVANLYFLFLVILQCIPIFGVVEPAVSALPLIAILVITGIKDGIEDWKRNQSDRRVNNAMTHTLSNWRNVNIPDDAHGTWYFLHVIFGFFSVLAGIENSYAQRYRAAMTRGKSTKSNRPRRDTEDKLPLTDLGPRSGTSSSASSQHNQPIEPTASPTRNRSQRLFTSMRQRSNTIRSNMSSIFKPPAARAPYRPGSIPHSVLYRIPTQESGAPRRPSTVHPTSLPCAATLPDEPPASNCRVQWEKTRWQDINVGDYIMVRNDEDVPADIVILSTSDNDNVCYVETKNLDGETNLKVRQALSATSEIKTVHDCERAAFYIESEPPHVNLYQYSGVMKWQIDLPEEHATARSGVSHEKTEAITFNNVLLRGCVLRNTEWVIGVVVFTGDETKIMLNSGRTPSKRSKIAKATNPHVVANFVILAVICIVSSVLNSVQFRQVGSGDLFEYGINGDSASYSGFLTFWVTLILYQNIVPISLYISVEIVKTVAAIFIWLDLDMYHAPTDAPCIPKTWNISDDLGQIEYIFSDKTGTLTQNVMEFRKCTINGVKYGLGETEASMGAKKREEGEKTMQDADTATAIDDATASAPVDTEVDMLQVAKDQMYNKQAQMFENKHVGSNPTFVDPKFFDDLSQEDSQADAITHFGVALALCHTVIAERPDEKIQEYIEYKAQSPDEAALVATARDLGFVFLGRESNTLHLEVKGEKKSFELLNVLEFNSTRKRMSVIVKPSGSDKIVLYCKGADSVIFERLCSEFGKQQDLREQQLELRAATTSHLEDFANEGLRTLCLGYRLISPEEYTPWNKKFQEASASLYNREEKIDEVCEEIERNMLLMGGTAIEDRLQDGVPETIAELAKSGIKLWVLTGDKTETAINIGFACNLLSNDMDLVVVKAQTREDTAEQLQKAANMVLAADNDKSVKRALVIDGTTLKYALEPATKETLLQIGMKCASVLCCRVSPKQKAQVVSLVKKGLKVMTLAIGDGANDVSMIQEANVGIGISGLEGRQAVMASDYAIAQFRFLHKLLLVHGRWSYLRTAETIMGFFYKNIVWTFVLFWYQIFCQFSGSMMFDYSLVTLYNLVFTSLPIIFLGIWDQDVNAKISLKYPEMYRMGLRSDKFQTWRFWLTVFDSIFQSSVCFFFPYMLLIAGAPDPRGYDSNGIYEIGTIVSGIAVCVANFFVGFSMYYFTWIQTGIIALSILVYYAFVCIYAQFNTFTFAGQDRLFSTGLYWVVFILTVVACFLPRLAAKYVMHQYYPYDNDIVREIELVMKKGRRQSETTTLEAPSCAPDKQKIMFTNSEPLEYLAPGNGESDIKMQERRSP